MSGFQVWNAQGVLTIDSNYRHTIATQQYVLPVGTLGDMSGPCPFGNLNTLGAISYNNMPRSNNLYWFRLVPNSWCFPGAWYFQPNTAEFVVTSRSAPIVSGYLDVFNSAGSLIWSAASAANMPRIRQILEINEINTNQIYTVNLDYTPFILLGTCPGEMSDDGEVAGRCGLLLKWTGGALQYTWINQYGKTFSQVFGGRGGLKLVLCEFTGR